MPFPQAPPPAGETALKIVYLGTPDFAAASLRALLEGPDQVVAVGTQPDRKKGRGQRVTVTAVKALALEAGLEVLQPERVRGARGAAFRERLVALQPDLIVVAAYGQILPPSVLATPPLGCLNVHASLLPRWRGASPIHHALLAGDAQTGVSIMQMDKGLDTGAVYASRALPIEADDSAETLHDKLAVLGAELLLEVIASIKGGKAGRPGQPRATPQPEEGVTYASMLRKEDGLLDFGRDAASLARQVRALTPWPSTYTSLPDGTRLKVRAAEVAPVPAAEDVAGVPSAAASDLALATASGAPGTILRLGPEGLTVACGQGALLLRELQAPGRKAMAAGDFARGRRLRPGQRLGVPVALASDLGTTDLANARTTAGAASGAGNSGEEAS